MSNEVYTQTAGQLITQALRDARIVDPEQPVNSVDFQNGLDAISAVIKHWQTQGIHLWSETEAVLPLVTNQRKYLLGPGGDDIAVASTFFNTTLLSAIVATDTIIPVTATTGLNEDGQSLTMAGAPGLLLTSPVTSTQDWTITDGVLALDPLGLLIINAGGVNAAIATFDLDTTPGDKYLVEFSYIEVSAVTATFSVFDSLGELDTVDLSATGDGTLEFTARDTITTFQVTNSSIDNFSTMELSALQYFNKAAGDRIGIELDDGSRFWDNIVSVDSATQVTINNGVPSGAAAAKSVYSYATAIARPLRLLQARFGSTFTASEIPVNQWSRDEYYDQPDKGSSGTVVNWYYSPKLARGELLVWQVASNVNQILRFTYSDPINVPTTANDSLEFPSEWLMPLKWGIAAEMGPGYGVNENRQLILEQKAATTLEDSLGHDVERDSMSLQPDFN